MDDPGAQLSLADAARRTLARPYGAQLLVDGLGPAGGEVADGVELVDRHGTPVLLCDPQAPLAGAARHGRGATLTLNGGDPAGGPAGGQGRHRVMFRGRLLLAGRDRVEEREVEQVELRLTSVMVRVADERGVAVPLADYHALGEPDLAAYAEALRAHTDTDHAADLRLFAARLSGAADRVDEADPHGVVAAASLAGLDATGTVLRWVDTDGAHEVRLVFPRAARSCHELSELLRHTLCPST